MGERTKLEINRRRASKKVKKIGYKQKKYLKKSWIRQRSHRHSEWKGSRRNGLVTRGSVKLNSFTHSLPPVHFIRCLHFRICDSLSCSTQRGHLQFCFRPPRCPSFLHSDVNISLLTYACLWLCALSRCVWRNGSRVISFSRIRSRWYSSSTFDRLISICVAWFSSASFSSGTISFHEI